MKSKTGLKKEKQEQTVFQKFFSHFSFFVALIVFLIGNFFGSILLIPAFLLTTKIYLDFFLLLFGFIFGLLFELIIINFEDQRHHTIIAGIVVPLFVFFNIYYITNLSNNISTFLFNSEGSHNPLFSSMAYLVTFIMPYVFHKVCAITFLVPVLITMLGGYYVQINF
ncbi:hypothetical protein HZA97_05460 [Candidatus Woesearchaeota archaeon]|nr:hypothetical protein [Candidatus Woesearchaeota archaeon]